MTVGMTVDTMLASSAATNDPTMTTATPAICWLVNERSISAMCHRRLGTRRGLTRSRSNDSARALDDRRIEHLAVERDGAKTLRGAFVVRGDDTSRVRDLIRRRRKDLVHDRDLSRMDALPAAEP